MNTPKRPDLLGKATRKKMLRAGHLAGAANDILRSIDQMDKLDPVSRYQLAVVVIHDVIEEAVYDLQRTRERFNQLDPIQKLRTEAVIQAFRENPGKGPAYVEALITQFEVIEDARTPILGLPPSNGEPDPYLYAFPMVGATDGILGRRLEGPQECGGPAPRRPVREEGGTRAPEGPHPQAQGPEPIPDPDPHPTGQNPASAQGNEPGSQGNTTPTGGELAGQGTGGPGTGGTERPVVRGLQPVAGGGVRPGRGAQAPRHLVAGVPSPVEEEGPEDPMALGQMAGLPDVAPAIRMDGNGASGTTRVSSTELGDAIFDAAVSNPVYQEARTAKELEDQWLDEPHDGTFTVDGDFDPRNEANRRPAWWGSTPTPAQVRSMFIGPLMAKWGAGRLGHVHFSELAFRVSPSGSGYHLKGKCIVDTDQGTEPATKGNTFILRRLLGDDPARLYYDRLRGDARGWLSDANNYHDRVTGIWQFKRAGTWVECP